MSSPLCFMHRHCEEATGRRSNLRPVEFEIASQRPVREAGARRALLAMTIHCFGCGLDLRLIGLASNPRQKIIASDGGCAVPNDRCGHAITEHRRAEVIHRARISFEWVSFTN